MGKISKNGLPRRFGFLLLNDFTLISFSSAIEPLRMANRICCHDHYSWRTISETGETVSASDGLTVNVDCSIDSEGALIDLDAIIVCGGTRVEKKISESLVSWLQAANQKGVGLGAICTGSFALAEAGLLDGHRCSIHWEEITALSDLFPNVAVNRNIYTIDRNRYTSSGGTSPVDMMLHFVRAQCGTEVNAGVAEHFIYERIRRSDDEQRVAIKHVVDHQSEKLVHAVELMQANIKEPLSLEDIAACIGVSKRQLQRLFQRHLSRTPLRHYLEVRLHHARELLRKTSLSLEEISESTGFITRSYFSKSFKEHYGHSPSFERQYDVEVRDV